MERTKRGAATIMLTTIVSLLAVMLSMCMFIQVAEAKTVSGGSNEQFTFTGLPASSSFSGLKVHTVQNFAITPDGKYVFTTSGADQGSKKNYTTILACLKMPAKTGAGATATACKVMKLKGYGHGETLAINQPNKKKAVYNLWIGSKAVGKAGYSTEISRLTYDVAKNKVIKTVHIKNFAKANVTKGKAAKFRQGKPERMNVAVDQVGNKICFRCCFKSGKGCDWVIYDFSKLDKALNKVKNNKNYDISKAAKFQRVHLYSTSKIYPSGLFQSFDISGNSLYIMGGHMNKGAGVYQVNFKMQKAGQTTIVKVTKPSKSVKINPKLTYGGTSYGKSQLEPEGIQVVGKKVYFNWFFKDTPIANNIPVYMIKV